jgi:hypothetical protein
VKKKIVYYCSITAAAAITLFCAGSSTMVSVGSIEPLEKQPAVYLDTMDITPLATAILSAVGQHSASNIQPLDSLQLKLVRRVQMPDSTIQYDIDNYIRFLSRNGVSVLILEPDTYESIRALAPLPVALCIAVTHFRGKDIANRNRTDLVESLHSGTIPGDYPVSIHCITSIGRTENGYRCQTNDGLTFGGLVNERLTGQIFTDHGGSYIQIAGVLVASSMQPIQIRGYLDEWFEYMPSGSGKPTIIPIQ